MLKHGYAYSETDFLKSVKCADGAYLVFNGNWYELAADGKCKMLTSAEAGRHLQRGISEAPFEVLEEDVNNSERVGLAD